MNCIDGFVKIQGQKLLNGRGDQILLRGVALGGWLLPEGYMWRFPEQGDRPRRIRKIIEDLVGREKSELFWETYYDRYISEEDIRQIAAEGFNSVRIPLNSSFLFEDAGTGRYNELHLELIDRMIGWCRDNNIYAVLDLHGAPGGQTGTNIDDSEHNLPELFMDRRNEQLTVAIWRMLAERYKDEQAVAGYDLLNEPLTRQFSAYNSRLVPLYREITEAIREVDKEHIIILEGTHWATDFSVFDEMFDRNIMLQFHKYWNNPDLESIRDFLDKREELNVPVFMGEGGENNKDWYAGTFRMLEDCGVSWNFWTWKKMDTVNSPCSVVAPEGWQQLADYAAGGVKPDVRFAERTLWEYLDNILFRNCIYRRDVVNAILRRPSVRIPAVFYGYRGEGISFGKVKKSKKHIGFRIHDGTDIRFEEGQGEVLNFGHGKGEDRQSGECLYIALASGDWAAYDFITDSYSKSKCCTVELCMRTNDMNGLFTVFADGIVLDTESVERGSWHTIRLKEILRLGPGQHRIVIRADKRTIHFKWLQLNDYWMRSTD